MKLGMIGLGRMGTNMVRRSVFKNNRRHAFNNCCDKPRGEPDCSARKPSNWET